MEKRILNVTTTVITEPTIIDPDGFSGWRAQVDGDPTLVMGCLLGLDGGVIEEGELIILGLPSVLDFTQVSPDVEWKTPITIAPAYPEHPSIRVVLTRMYYN